MGIRRDTLASPIAIKRDADLSRFNTLRLPARAAGYVRIVSADALAALAGPPEMVWPRFVLGGGMSNVGELSDRLPEVVARHAFCDHWDGRIVAAKWGDSSGVRGAARLWAD